MASASDIGDHVRGVGEQRERTECEAADDLDHEKPGVGRQCDEKRPS